MASSSELSEEETTMPESFNDLAQSIAVDNTFSYGDFKIKRDIESLIQQGDGGYIHVTEISEDGVISVDRTLKRVRLRKMCRFTYDSSQMSLIIRCMPGAPHEGTCWYFHIILYEKIKVIPNRRPEDLFPLGATVFTNGAFSKQADSSYRCTTRCNGFPNFVVEVGYFRSLNQLQLDARNWLEYFNGVVRYVLLIEVSVNLDFMTIERWEMGVEPQCITHLVIDDAGTIHPAGVGLTIPYLCLFEENGPQNIVFTDVELIQFANKVFQFSVV